MSKSSSGEEGLRHVGGLHELEPRLTGRGVRRREMWLWVLPLPEGPPAVPQVGA